MSERETYRQIVVRTRAEQGLPPEIDPRILKRIEFIFRQASLKRRGGS